MSDYRAVKSTPNTRVEVWITEPDWRDLWRCRVQLTHWENSDYRGDTHRFARYRQGVLIGVGNFEVIRHTSGMYSFIIHLDPGDRLEIAFTEFTVILEYRPGAEEIICSWKP